MREVSHLLQVPEWLEDAPFDRDRAGLKALVLELCMQGESENWCLRHGCGWREVEEGCTCRSDQQEYAAWPAPRFPYKGYRIRPIKASVSPSLT